MLCSICFGVDSELLPAGGCPVGCTEQRPRPRRLPAGRSIGMHKPSEGRLYLLVAAGAAAVPPGCGAGGLVTHPFVASGYRTAGPCRHAFCRACLASHLTVQLRSCGSDLPVCPQLHCSGRMDQAACEPLLALLPPATRERCLTVLAEGAIPPEQRFCECASSAGRCRLGFCAACCPQNARGLIAYEGETGEGA